MVCPLCGKGSRSVPPVSDEEQVRVLSFAEQEAAAEEELESKIPRIVVKASSLFSEEVAGKLARTVAAKSGDESCDSGEWD